MIIRVLNLFVDSFINFKGRKSPNTYQKKVQFQCPPFIAKEYYIHQKYPGCSEKIYGYHNTGSKDRSEHEQNECFQQRLFSAGKSLWVGLVSLEYDV